MKKALLAVLIVFVIALAAIAGWYANHTRQIEAELTQYKQWAEAQKRVKVQFVVTAPPETPANQSLWISGNATDLGGWDGAGVQLARGEDGKYRGEIEVMSGVEYAYKVTRGSWSTVERGPKGEEIPNHILKVSGDTTAEVAVATWVDGGKSVAGLHTLAGVVREHRKFRSELLKNERTLIVFLPPGYDEAAESRYPVLYIHDGQNLFDSATSFAGIEWKLDEAAQKLMTSGQIEPAIIVGIYNTEQRTIEFTPPAPGSPASDSAAGDLYARFVVEEVKPFIDQTYRTRPERASTSLAGSSMGGLISLHILRKHPTVFGQAALLTPHLRLPERDFVVELTASGPPTWIKGMRLWIEMGDKPGDNYPGTTPMDDARRFAKQLDAAGLSAGSDYILIEAPGGEHNETAWQAQVEPMLKFLYGRSAT